MKLWMNLKFMQKKQFGTLIGDSAMVILFLFYFLLRM